jgi:peptide/nickel transport system substrate-binding protein
MKKILFISLAIILICGIFLIGCGKGTSTVTQTSTTTVTKTASTTASTSETTTTSTSTGKKSGGLLRIISNEIPAGSIGVPERQGGLSGSYTMPIIERLIKSDLKGGLVGVLAETWDVTNGGKTITFHLRKGVKFHDGTDFNAKAVEWNFNRRIAAGVGGTDNIASIATPDDNTFVVNLKEYMNTFLKQMGGEVAGTPIGVVMSPAAVDQHSEEYADFHPVGTGPLKFKEYVQDTSFEMERNDNYWGGKTYLDGVKWIFITDTVSAELAFQSGESDVLFQIGKSTQIMRDLIPKGYYADKFDGLNICLIPSSGSPNSPFAKLEVRQAVEYAINRDKICQSVLAGYAQPRYQLAIPLQFTYIPDFQGRRYDPDKARQLLKDAGYASGFDTTIWAQFTLAGDEITAIQSNLKDVGINANIEIMDVPKWIDAETNGWDEGMDVTPQGSGGYASFLQRYWVKPNAPNWTSGLYWKTLDRPDDLEAMIQAYFRLPTQEEQLTAGREIIQKMFDIAFAIPLWQLDDCFMLQPYVHDLNVGKKEFGISFDALGAWMDQ